MRGYGTDYHGDDSPAATHQWAPCARCGERLEFGTNGMGRVVESCPVCDWGHPPTRAYAAFARRIAVAPPEESLRRAAPKTCVRPSCGATFIPRSNAQTTCSDACRQAIRRVRERASRTNRRPCVRCERPFIALTRQAVYCADCRTWAVREAKLRYWEKKRAARAQGDAA